jgi:hypothetical protein
MSKYKIGDKVYLEGKISEYDERDNTYCVEYSDYHKISHITYCLKDDVLHPTDELYNKGLNDAWELAKKIILPSHMGGYTTDEFKNIFGKNTYISAISDFTPQEALAKVKKYEEHNVIKVGDVVRLKGCSVEGIVTRITETNIYRLFRDGSSTKEAYGVVEGFAKTGEHFDSIDEFMRSEE